MGNSLAATKGIGAVSCLVKGLKALYPNLFSCFVFAFLLSVVSVVPTLIDRVQGLVYLTPPISLWGFLMSLVFWTAQTLVLVGVGQIVWRNLKNESNDGVRLATSKMIRPEILYWSVCLTVIIFSFVIGSELLVQSVSKKGHYIPLPVLPLFLYFFAFIPLMIVDRQVSMSKAIHGLVSSLKENFFVLFKLTLIALAVEWTFIALSVAVSDGFIHRSFSLPEAIVIDQVLRPFFEAPMWLINSGMMAVAYAELYGES